MSHSAHGAARRPEHPRRGAGQRSGARAGLALALGALTCARHRTVARTQPQPGAAATARWERVNDSDAGVHYDVPAGSVVSAMGSAFNHAVTFAQAAPHPFNIVVQTGPLFTLDFWRTQWPAGTAMRVRALTVCNAPASIAEHETEPGPLDPGGLPRPTTYAVLFARGARGTFAAQWVIGAVDRAARSRDEERFFASFRCP